MPPAQSQPVETGLSGAAIFVVLTVGPGARDLDRVRAFCGDLGALIRGVGFRSAKAGLTCIMGIGAGLWQRLGQPTTPKGLHVLAAIDGVHAAPSTPGDILLHIRAATPDFCFELLTHIMARLGDAVTVEDETQGFKFFDNRDLLGFVDGTENPTGAARTAAVLIGDEDPDFAGGSYVIVQKYIHDLAKWNAIPVETQERIIGRHKLSDIELPDAEKPSYAHNVLNSINDEDGNALEILRDNMPFGNAARGEFGTYYIAYARSPDPTERMLRNMFIGDPPGNYDRILDVSTAITGTLFFVPTVDLLESLVAPPAPDRVDPVASGDGSLGLGSLKRGN